MITMEDIIKYAQNEGYDTAVELLTYKDEVVYTGRYNIPLTTGFPLLMTIRNNKIYEYTREEIIEIMSS